MDLTVLFDITIIWQLFVLISIIVQQSMRRETRKWALMNWFYLTSQWKRFTKQPQTCQWFESESVSESLRAFTGFTTEFCSMYHESFVCYIQFDMNGNCFWVYTLGLRDSSNRLKKDSSVYVLMVEFRNSIASALTISFFLYFSTKKVICLLNVSL